MAESRGSRRDLFDWVRSCPPLADSGWSDVQQAIVFKNTVFIVQKCAVLHRSPIAVITPKLQHGIRVVHCGMDALIDRNERDDREGKLF